MSEIREEIVVGNYAFTDFIQTDGNTVTIYGRKVDFSKLAEKDKADVLNILKQLDLWESFVLSIGLINKILKEENFDEMSLKEFYRPDKYDFEIFNEKPQYKSIGVHIEYKKIEARRTTMGASDKVPLTVDEIKTRLKNVKKWTALKTIIGVLRAIENSP